jgi:hypothetical protein
MKKLNLLLLMTLFMSSLFPVLARSEEDKLKYRNIRELLMGNNLAHKDKSFLYLFVHPSYQVFDYSSARDFQRSSLYTGAYDTENEEGHKTSFMEKVSQALWGYDLNSVGHVQFAWYCNTRNDLYTGATGYTGEENDQVKEMVEQGWGLTAMLADFNDGSFEPEDYITEDLESSWHNEDGFFWMGVEVTKEQCFNAQFFLEDFMQKAPSTFSFNRDPDKFEGGVCSSIAASFFRNAKTPAQPLIDATHRSVRISKEVLGNVPSAKLPEAVGLPEFAMSLPEKNVNKFSLLLKPIPFNPKRNYKSFNFYDPELMGFMIKRLEAEFIGGKSQMMSRKKVQLNKPRGGHEFSRDRVGYRKRKYTLDYVEVSRKTDSSYQGVYDAVKRFKRNNPNIKVSRKKLEGKPGIIIEMN